MPIVVCQYWDESERGWGVRPDGFSLHRTMADLDAFVKEHNDRLPTDYIPDEYTRVSGEPKALDVPKSIAKAIKGNGKWFIGTPERLIAEARNK